MLFLSILCTRTKRVLLCLKRVLTRALAMTAVLTAAITAARIISLRVPFSSVSFLRSKIPGSSFSFKNTTSDNYFSPSPADLFSAALTVS